MSISTYYINATGGAGGSSSNDGLAPVLVTGNNGPANNWASLLSAANIPNTNLLASLSVDQVTAVLVGEVTPTTEGTGSGALLGLAAGITGDITRPIVICGSSDAHGMIGTLSDRRWVSRNGLKALYGGSISAPTIMALRGTIDGANSAVLGLSASFGSNILFRNLRFYRVNSTTNSNGRLFNVTNSDSKGLCVDNCVFEESDGWGAFTLSPVKFRRCIFYKCNLDDLSSSAYGGGAYGTYFEDCDFVECNGRSAQVPSDSGSCTIVNCRFWGAGGSVPVGLFVQATSSAQNPVIIRNCTFYNCVNGILLADNSGSTTNASFTNVTIDSCIFVNCLNAIKATGLSNTYIASLTNCHFFNNTNNMIGVTALLYETPTTSDPLFYNAASGDFRLKQNSPAIRYNGQVPGGAISLGSGGSRGLI